MTDFKLFGTDPHKLEFRRKRHLRKQAYYLPKIQSNFYIGIKTPRTLSSDIVWRKTHRLGGKLYVACGILILFSTLTLPIFKTMPAGS
ncbi:MAG: SdpI family protein [Lachnospiraceae bacterium]|nr:SdpI family protein [Lachnospiraceae bacterium]